MNYLFGWNPVAEFVLDEFAASGISIHGVVMDDAYIGNTTCPNDLPIHKLSSISFKSEDSVINCLGYKDLERRIQIGELLLRLGVLKSFISRHAQVHPSTLIREGAVLVGDVVIERNCEIGKHGLLWGGSRICHDSTLQAGVFLASGSIIGGGCTVGQTCSLGFNSSMREKSYMPNGTKVGANHFWRPVT
jgi:NDP-sugar pyrophosphorylase family protein